MNSMNQTQLQMEPQTTQNHSSANIFTDSPTIDTSCEEEKKDVGATAPTGINISAGSTKTMSPQTEKRPAENTIEQDGPAITWYWREEQLPPIPEGRMEIQRDTPNGKVGSKQFAVSSWEEVYAHVKKAYDRTKYLPWYEQRNRTSPCNFHVDVDDEKSSETDFDENAYLKQIREDFNAHGITEPWKLQKSSGAKNGKYKVSYHITIPSVRFESHKHLKQWFQNKCIKTTEEGINKNGGKKTKSIYKLGSTKIDMSVYGKGAWRFPMCSKAGSVRVLEYKDEEMTLEVFKSLSIHYIKNNARTIKVELSTHNPIRRKRSHAEFSSGGELSDGNKKRYNLIGTFVWGNTKDDGQDVTATSNEWTCPFGRDHNKKNRQLKIKDHAVYCYGCDTETEIGEFHIINILINRREKNILFPRLLSFSSSSFFFLLLLLLLIII